MKVALISIYNSYPVGLRYIASSLESRGHSVTLVKMENPTDSRILRLLREEEPNVVGFTCYTLKILKVLDAASRIKRYSPKTKIVLGNIHATLYYHKILEEFPYVDFVVLGEGEVPMEELLEHIIGQRHIDEVHNIAYRTKEGYVIRTEAFKTLPPLDALSDYLIRPIPADVLFSDYHKLRFIFFSGRKIIGEPYVSIITSRGCPYGCSYCAENHITHQTWRAHSSVKVVDMIERFYKDYNISYFSFRDPDFAFDKDRVKSICAEILNRKLGIKWSFQTHPNDIDDELIHILHKAGCVGFAMGIDCLTDEMMHKYRKVKIDYADFVRVINVARTLKMTVKINIIAGWPDSRFGDIFEIVRNIKKLKPSHICIFSLRFLPGSKMFKEAVERGIVDAYAWLDEHKDPCPLAIAIKGRIKITDMIKLRI